MANWLDLEKIETWDYAVIIGFQYDSVTDDAISAALADVEAIRYVDPNIDWEDDSWLSENTSIPDDQKHAYRVAALVHMLSNGGKLQKAISLDTFCVMQCCSCISNGHHRIRALQYMGKSSAPFSLSGHLDALEELVAVAGVSPPPNASDWCGKKIFSTIDDIHPRKRGRKAPR